MPNSLDLSRTAIWFKNPGPDNDVVLSSRVRLGRNLAGFPFPQTMTQEQESRARDQILDAFKNLDPSSGYTPYILDDLRLLDVKLLLERNIITQEYSLGKNKAVVFDSTGSVSVMINETDHLKMAAIQGGNRLKEAWQAVDSLDTALDEKLDYAVSLEWGYLGPFLTGVGTQMRASLMLHLPALVFTALISKAVKTIASFGLSIKGFFADGEESLGDIYQISN
ncbi:MAG: ATP--guanido phosphotransferase, partial [Spirochaetaceae bacterium]